MSSTVLVRNNLPSPVYELALRLGAKPNVYRFCVLLTQAGRMKRNLKTQAWMAFTASQTMSTHACSGTGETGSEVPLSSDSQGRITAPLQSSRQT